MIYIKMVPLINFKSTTLFRAFLLNSLAIAISAAVAIEIRELLNDKTSYIYNFVNGLIPGKTLNRTTIILVTFVAAFTSSCVTLLLLHILFGYGAAMIIDPKFKYSNPNYF
jgi:hypothetical protein